MDSQADSPLGTLRIERIEVIPLDTLPPLRRRLPTGPVAYGEGNLLGRSVLVAVRAGGITGWGQLRPVNPFQGETGASMVAALRDVFAPMAIGRDPWHRAALLRDCWRTLPFNPAALATLDIAIHDLLGRALGLPVHALLGGACKETIPLEWSIGLGTPEAMLDEAQSVRDRFSIPYLCVKVGPQARFQQDVKVVRGIAERFGDRARVAMDANASLAGRDAIRLAQAVADVEPAYFEQPVAQGSLAEMRRVRDAGVPVMADESIYSPEHANLVLNAGAADVACIKLYKCGGLYRGRQIATVAEAAGFDVNCAGTCNGSHLEALAAAHLGAAVPNHAFGAEFTMGLPDVAPDAIAPENVMPIRDGHVPIPPGPGLGVAVDEAAVARHALDRIVVDAGGTHG